MKESGQIAVSAVFDIAFVTSHFSTCDLIYYLNLIRTMSSDELRALRANVLEHKRTSRAQQAFADVENLSTHQAIIKAIDHELLRRSSIFRIAVALFPVRKFIVEKFSGSALRLDDRFGVIYSKPKYRRTIWHIHHRAILASIWQFIVRNERAFVTAILGGVGYLLVTYVI